MALFLPEFKPNASSSKQHLKYRLLLCIPAVLSIFLLAYTFLPSSPNHSNLLSRPQHISSSTILTSRTHPRAIKARWAPSKPITVASLTTSFSFAPKKGQKTPGRLILIGDVHGMYAKLLELLKKVKFDKTSDHLVFVGDIVSRGPQNAEVVDYLEALGPEVVSVVMGNHEDRLLTEAGSKPDKDKDLIKELGPKRIEWISKFPVILKLGKLGKLNNLVVAHAGLVPGIALEGQDPEMVMNMITMKDKKPSVERTGVSWTEEWNSYQKGISENKQITVVYGHDSRTGLLAKPYSIGIDTRCDKGGKLTAMVVDAVVVKAKISDYAYTLKSVDCK